MQVIAAGHLVHSSARYVYWGSDMRAFVFALLLLSAPLSEGNSEQVEYFKFFNACGGVAHHVSVIANEEANTIPLAEKDLANILESRLRGARVYREADISNSNLIASVILVGDAYALSLSFQKARFADPYTEHQNLGILRFVTTWQRYVLGTTGDYDPGPALTTLSKLTDDFLVGYLRANTEEACDSYRSARRAWEEDRETEWEAARADGEAELRRRWAENGNDPDDFDYMTALLEDLESEFE